MVAPCTIVGTLDSYFVFVPFHSFDAISTNFADKVCILSFINGDALWNYGVGWNEILCKIDNKNLNVIVINKMCVSY